MTVLHRAFNRNTITHTMPPVRRDKPAVVANETMSDPATRRFLRIEDAAQRSNNWAPTRF
jgi:hypothetical protein